MNFLHSKIFFFILIFPFFFLQKLRKYCDIVDVANAHDLMKNLAGHINQVKREIDQKNRVTKLMDILDGWLGPSLTVLGDLILEGTLMENSKPRCVLLFETMIIIAKKKEDERLQLKTFIHVSCYVS